LVPTSKTRHSIDPATGTPLYEVPIARKEDVDVAVEAARRAFRSWSTTPFAERAQLLLKYAELLEESREEMQKLLTLEQGKPLSLSKTEMDCALTWLRAFATMEIKDEVLQEDDEKTIYSTYPPLGVCAGIVWNPITPGLCYCTDVLPSHP
jgi:acyl-CoA reductase-like NAD-dependent aldehyde dehydrogenase